MAICLTVTPGGVFAKSGSTDAVVRGATAGATTGTAALREVPYSVDVAVYAGGEYSCSTGSYLLLTPAETNSLGGVSPFVAGPEHYAAVTAVFGVVLLALCLVWGAKKVLQLLNQHTDS